MCLCIAKGVNGVRICPQTATEPIKVYKFLSPGNKTIFGGKKWVSPVMRTPVKFLFGKSKLGNGIMEGYLVGRYGLTYRMTWKNGEIGSAFMHHNVTGELPCEPGKIDPMPSGGVVENGIHAIVSLDDGRYAACFGEEKNKVFEAVIPKGAHYYVGDFGDIVADRMIVYKNGIKDESIKTLEYVLK